ncbi:TonB family protein [Terricaulis silvestris]|uniref:TonB C-terminal domain-containing protein n=1 Tax=Terricaulis silvestris TaxID=2686094 RepID=A0A6I6MLF6_9CAUL|nr:TonB family protein [Terricaulis silvestris]QGZ94098.1 hypothetical protein DSM104635_00914 [Terricaulis silvestris]
MSDDPNHGATEIRATKGGGGGAGKWLLGGLAAVVLLGGGYFAWKSTQPTNQTDLETAYNDTYDADQVRAGPLGSSDDLTADTASDDSAPPAAASSERRSTSARSSTASADTVPEETIGIMPVNASGDELATTASNGDDIVVTAPPRPIWDRTPSARRLSAFYPDRALQRGREGEARLHCTVLDGGALDCAKVSETPGGGFGNAALRVSRSLRHAAVRRDGADATGTPVNLRVVFRIEDDRRG